ncbi:MAG: hypothetical protein LBJ21_09140 [Acidobacteriota bacterium]|jgi:hypothetical protein|nr:hypothetical protein [Acidobacteriota bacterium]
MWISCVILVLAAGGYALWPLFAKTFDESESGAEARPAETGAEYLTDRKTAVYRNIKDLEFDYKMGRLADADFQRLEAEFKGEAAEILQKLDMLNDHVTTPASAPDIREGFCPGCGAKTIPGKKFCADCGALLH